MRRFTLVLTLVLVSCPLYGQERGAAERKKREEAVERALAFLKIMQEADGSWQVFAQKHTAVSALAVMSFLSAGHVPGEGPYGEVVEKGVRWVLKQQQPSGLFATEPGLEMYHHGICTLLLAEVTGMVDAATSKELRPKLEKAVAVILKAQVQETQSRTYQGGWRYRVDSTDADLSVSGWQILALRAAKNVGCDIPAERIEQALEFVKRCRDNSGGFCYFPGNRVTKACTGTAILMLELAGKDLHHSREALQAGSYLLKHPLQFGDEHFFYAVYYSSQAMFQLGGNYHRFWEPQIQQLLYQYQQPNGSWIGNDGYGPIYATTMALLALTVEYRFLPIYQREEK
jgi:prenyltransferase beta subunit